MKLPCTEALGGGGGVIWVSDKWNVYSEEIEESKSLLGFWSEQLEEQSCQRPGWGMTSGGRRVICVWLCGVGQGTVGVEHAGRWMSLKFKCDMWAGLYTSERRLAFDWHLKLVE